MKKHLTRNETGVTLVESAVVLAVIGVLLSSLLPNLGRWMDDRLVQAAANQLRTDFQFARSAAASGNQSVRISFGSGANTCYVVHTGSASDCRCSNTETPVCKPGARALRLVRFDTQGPVSVASNSASMLIDHHHATVSPTGTMQIKGRHGTKLHLVVNIMGKVRSCAAEGILAGQPRC